MVESGKMSLGYIKGWGATFALRLRATLRDASETENLAKIDFAKLHEELAQFEALVKRADELGVDYKGWPKIQNLLDSDSLT